VAAIIAKYLFGMPWVVAFLLGYTIACISPSVLVPCLIKLIEKGYGSKKGIPTSLIAAGTFDDIVLIICNGICLNITIGRITPSATSKSLALAIIMLFVQIISGFIIGGLMGIIGLIFNKLPKYKYLLHAKTVYCMICIIAFPVVADVVHFPNVKFIASLMFGYVGYRVWGENKPSVYLYKIWFFLQPFLFGTVGA
jgi:NhaP-type Na+/H+ or K+/H+ antiporter